MANLAGAYFPRSKQPTIEGTGVTRGSIAPWREAPPGPDAYVTLLPKDRGTPGAGEAVVPWHSRTGVPTSLRGSVVPNYTSTLTRAPNGSAPSPLAESLHHGPTARRAPFNNTSTAANDRDSWETRGKGGNRGTDAPWDSMRHLTRPTQQGPGGPGWTYAQRSPPDITSSSTASTNVASWTTRLAADGKLLGSQRPNTVMRVPKSNPDHLLSTTGGPTSYVEGFNTTSTAANDRGSWHYRQAVVAEKTQRLGATWSSGQHAAASGQGGSGAGTGRLGGTGRTGAVYGSNYVRTSRPDITQWSTASVNKESWEYRVNQSFPNHLTFQTARF